MAHSSVRNDIRALASRQAGVLTRRQARELGVGAEQQRRLVESGEWTSRLGCLHVAPLSSDPDWCDAWALGLRLGPHVIVSGPTALRLASLNVSDDQVIVWCGPDARIRLGGVTVLRDTAPRRTRPGPVCPIAEPTDALIDLMLCSPDMRSVELMDQALQRHWITPTMWQESVVGRLGRGRDGAQKLRRLDRMLSSGARSEAERWHIRILTRAGIVGWVANYPLVDENGVTCAELDVAWPHLKLCIEVDGRAYHSDRAAFERDRERQNLLVLQGWTVLRFTWEQIKQRPGWVVAQIRAAIARCTAVPA